MRGPNKCPRASDEVVEGVAVLRVAVQSAAAAGNFVYFQSPRPDGGLLADSLAAIIAPRPEVPEVDAGGPLLGATPSRQPASRWHCVALRPRAECDRA